MFIIVPAGAVPRGDDRTALVHADASSDAPRGASASGRARMEQTDTITTTTNNKNDNNNMIIIT